jgi:hypothetical protein
LPGNIFSNEARCCKSCRRVGADRLVSAVAARRPSGNLCVISAATTFDVVSADGAYRVASFPRYQSQHGCPA